jgi:hypothetical protein
MSNPVLPPPTPAYVSALLAGARGITSMSVEYDVDTLGPFIARLKVEALIELSREDRGVYGAVQTTSPDAPQAREQALALHARVGVAA